MHYPVKTSNLSELVRLSNIRNLKKDFKSCKIWDNRLKELLGSFRRMQDVCEHFSPEFGNNDGYYRGCYQRFTMNISRLKATSKPRKKTETLDARRGSTKGKNKNFF